MFAGRKTLFYFLLAIQFINHAVLIQPDGYVDDQPQYFTNNDLRRILNDIWRKLGVEGFLRDMDMHLKISIVSAQSYQWKDYERDLQFVKKHPSLRNVIWFVRQVTWPGIVNLCIEIINSFFKAEMFLLQFLKEKMDTHCGPDGAFHPWNLMIKMDDHEMSFVVFLLTASLSLVFIKFLSWWNFMVYLSFCVIVHSLCGPFRMFDWLLVIIALAWLLMDLVFTYPLQFSVGIISITIISFVRFILPTPKKLQNIVRSPRKIIKNSSDDLAEFRELQSRMDSMEIKTDLLNQRLGELTVQIERVLDEDD